MKNKNGFGKQFMDTLIEALTSNWNNLHLNITIVYDTEIRNIDNILKTLEESILKTISKIIQAEEIHVQLKSMYNEAHLIQICISFSSVSNVVDHVQVLAANIITIIKTLCKSYIPLDIKIISSILIQEDKTGGFSYYSLEPFFQIEK